MILSVSIIFRKKPYQNSKQAVKTWRKLESHPQASLWFINLPTVCWILSFTLRPCAFFLCFSSPACEAFVWKLKKKKTQCQNQTKIVHSVSRSATRARRLLADSWLSGRCNFFTVIARRREKTFPFLRSLMEEDDRIDISNHSLFKKHHAFHSCTFVKAKKHDAFHSCTFLKALSKFQCLLAMIKRHSSASESGHEEPKATMPPVEISEHGLCWE